MKIKVLSAVILFILLSQLSVVSSKPLVVKIGFFAKELSVHSSEETFDAELYMWIRMPNTDRAWSLFNWEDDPEALEFVNGDIEELTIDEGYQIGEEYYVNARVKGSFHYISNYYNYPFDSQELPIEIEHAFLESDEIIFVADQESIDRAMKEHGSHSLSDELDIGELEISGVDYSSSVRVYRTDFGDLGAKSQSSYSRLTYALKTKRNYWSFLFKAFIPLTIVLTLAYLVFFIPAGQLELAGGLTVTSLLAAIAFQWTLGDNLPSVGYLTIMDYVFYLTYFLIMAAMVQTIYTFNLENSSVNQAFKLKLSNWLEWFGRISYPIVYFGSVIYIIIANG